MSLSAKQPIGIFDSGIGGLTVANAVTQLLPHEDVIYFGDTAHLPYGDKSAVVIQDYSVKICEMLLQQHCKLILIACYSASSAAYDHIKEQVGDRAIVINMIDPMVTYLHTHYLNKHVGLIGTKQTIYSNVFKNKVIHGNVDIKLSSLATPLFVPMIEEGLSDHPMIHHMVDYYLQNPILDKIEALILGCTHYPLIKQPITNYYDNRIKIIDSSEIIAQAVKLTLEKHHLLNNNHANYIKKFYASDYTEPFARAAKMFFKHDLQLEHYPLWD